MKRTVIPTRKISFVLIMFSLVGCTDFVNIDPPRTSLVTSTVFSSDATANAAMVDIYYQLQSASFAGGGITSVSFLATLLSDEQENYNVSGSQDFQQFNNNNVLVNNSVLLIVWTDIYGVIYKCNAVLEGINESTSLTPELKKQLEGEARFIRSFCYFYLINLWGEVPKVTTTNYETNSKIPRTPVDEIYTLIKEDLTKSIDLLPSDFPSFGNERVRATTWAAYALLARTHLFTKNWTGAMEAATAVIDNDQLFHLVALNDVFRTTSEEAIFQLWGPSRPRERGTFRFFNIPTNGALREEFANSFEPGDERQKSWMDTTASGYYRAIKYYEPALDPPVQYSTVIRLAELYLIRAEASAQLDNTVASTEDINVIRNRAGLSDVNSLDKETILTEILQQRKAELFTEWGHRWFDLKRTDNSTSVLSGLKPAWKSSSTLLPVPQQETRNNPLLLPQNPGY